MIGSHIKDWVQLIGSLTYTSRTGLSHTNIKDWVHDRLSHTNIKDWVHETALARTSTAPVGQRQRVLEALGFVAHLFIRRALLDALLEQARDAY
jgi:hypothetical protein